MFKGWLGEKETQFNLWLSLDKKLYQRIHDVIIPSSHGTTQIDHILISPFGIFIIETKNYTGWIYGSKFQKNWTQVIYGYKYRFQNPLRQTHRQKKILSEYLKITESLIQPIVFFVGDSEFKTELPSNVLDSDLASYIHTFNETRLSDSEIKRISNALSNLKSNTRISHQEHLDSLEERYTSEKVCPKCASGLVVRTVKDGSRKGSQFLGCTNFPKCRFTRSLDTEDFKPSQTTHCSTCTLVIAFAILITTIYLLSYEEQFVIKIIKYFID
ncbi:MAG: NERD domain-containing protein [Desulfovibrionaceae bacterium]